MANSRRRCAHCREYELQELMRKNNCGWFCSIDCEAQYGLNKHRKQKEKAANANFKAMKMRVKGDDAKKQMTLTQKSFNKMRRLEELQWFADRDLPPRCISCQGLLGNDTWCCGHFKTTHNTALRFDPVNTYLQHNQRCNMQLSGDIAGTHNTMGYRAGLLVRFGQLKGQQILDYCDNTNPIIDLTVEDLKAKRKHFNAEIRRLEKAKA
jgi:hypothetical protein